jgi:phage baseplate assembly protein W
MKTRSRGWRYLVPRFDAPGEPVGLVTDPRGAIDTVADDEAVRQSLLLLISTRPGERVMRPEYGCNLNRLVHAPNDDTTAGLAIHFVRQAVARWEPRVDVVRVDASSDEDDSTRLQITLNYRVRATQRAGQITLPVALQDGKGP